MKLERSINLAVMVHQGQVDKGGEPYILHPLRVMLSMKTLEGQIVGVLHDTIEDRPKFTLDSLVKTEDVSDEIRDALDAITRGSQESYDDYITRVSENPLAREVKIADLRDNLHCNRVRNIPQRLSARYIKALARLLHG